MTINCTLTNVVIAFEESVPKNSISKDKKSFSLFDEDTMLKNSDDAVISPDFSVEAFDGESSNPPTTPEREDDETTPATESNITTEGNVTEDEGDSSTDETTEDGDSTTTTTVKPTTPSGADSVTSLSILLAIIFPSMLYSMILPFTY